MAGDLARQTTSNHGKQKSHQVDEQKKKVITTSTTRIFRHCLIHLLPISASITILVINIKGYYIGIDFPGFEQADTLVLMFLQIAAKVHELTVVASLSLIVFDMVRHELLFGDGLPLGFVGSGLSFSNFSLFFGKEFYGALQYVTGQGRTARKVGFIALLIVSALTAVLTGPASAVLIIPKTQPYPMGDTDFYLNGSYGQFWPDDLTGNMTELRRYCNNVTSTNLSICPAGGYSSLWDRWTTISPNDFEIENIPAYAKELAGARFYWPVSSPHSQIPPLYALGNLRLPNATLQPYTWLVQTHAASAVLLQRIAADWWKAVLSQRNFYSLNIDNRKVKSSVPSVISAIRCADPAVIPLAHKAVQFPSIEGRWDWAQSLDFEIDGFNLSSADHLRLRWIHLPENFGPSSIGVLFETAWDTVNQSRVVVGCSTQLGWVPTTVITDSYTFWSGWYPWGIQFGERYPSWIAGSSEQALAQTNGRIAVGDEWLNLLTPPVPVMNVTQATSTMTILENILHNMGLGDPFGLWNASESDEGILIMNSHLNNDSTRLLEGIICSILADGLSRSGSHRVFNTTKTPSEWSLGMYNPLSTFDNDILHGRTAFATPDLANSDVVTLNARMEISGFSFNIALAGYLSMAVLLVHMAMAVVHMVWLLRSQQTSSSWSSISEIIALAQNSRPALNVLADTGAGISRAQTFAKIAKIRVTESVENPADQRIELIFEEDSTSLAGLELSYKPAAVQGSDSDTTETVNKIRGSWTFPLDPHIHRRPSASGFDGLSTERERLISGNPLQSTTMLDKRRESLVRINQRYS